MNRKLLATIEMSEEEIVQACTQYLIARNDLLRVDTPGELRIERGYTDCREPGGGQPDTVRFVITVSLDKGDS